MGNILCCVPLKKVMWQSKNVKDLHLLSSICSNFFFLSGYGLRCHRAVITLCKLIGIEDMYAKVDGSVNLLNITRALFHGLANQVRDFNSTIANQISLCTHLSGLFDKVAMILPSIVCFRINIFRLSWNYISVKHVLMNVYMLLVLIKYYS